MKVTVQSRSVPAPTEPKVKQEEDPVVLKLQSLITKPRARRGRKSNPKVKTEESLNVKTEQLKAETEKETKIDTKNESKIKTEKGRKRRSPVVKRENEHMGDVKDTKKIKLEVEKYLQDALPGPASARILRSATEAYRKAMQPEKFFELPKDILNMILSRLTIEDYANLLSTCKEFKSAFDTYEVYRVVWMANYGKITSAYQWPELNFDFMLPGWRCLRRDIHMVELERQEAKDRIDASIRKLNYQYATDHAFIRKQELVLVTDRFLSLIGLRTILGTLYPWFTYRRNTGMSFAGPLKRKREPTTCSSCA